jgi:hypothetical protein
MVKNKDSDEKQTIFTVSLLFVAWCWIFRNKNFPGQLENGVPHAVRYVCSYLAQVCF